MAAPLPTGFQLPVYPTAPNIGDPRMYASDPQGALATAHVGMLLGQELANIENQKAKRALEAEQIKLAVQKNKLDTMMLEETARILPSVAGQIARVELEARTRLPEQQLGLNALAQNGILFSPGGPMSPSTDFVPPSSGQAAGVLSGERASPTDSTTSLPVPGDGQHSSSPFTFLPPNASKQQIAEAIAGSPTNLAKRIETNTLRQDNWRNIAFTNEQKALEEVAAPYLSQNKIVRSDLLREDGLGLDRQKVEQAVATAAKLYPNISRKGDAQWGADQRRVAENLNRFVSVFDISRSGVKDDEGNYDVPKADKLFQDLSVRYPVQAGLIKQPELEALRAEKRALESFESAAGKIDQLGDPAVIDRILNTMPDPEKARGIFENAKSNLAKRNVSPDTVARMALLNALNAQYQSVINDSKEGRQLRNFTPLDADQTNKALKAVLGVVTPFLREKYQNSLENYPDPVRKYVEGPRSVRQASAEAKAPAQNPLMSLGSGNRAGETKQVQWNGANLTYRWGSQGGLMGWKLVR